MFTSLMVHYQLGLIYGNSVRDFYSLRNGSVVELIQYEIIKQNHLKMMVIIFDLDEVTKCDIIGQPIELPLPQEVAGWQLSCIVCFISLPFPSHPIFIIISIPQVLSLNFPSLSAGTLTKGAVHKLLSPNFSCDDQEFKPVFQAIAVTTKYVWMCDGFSDTIGILSSDLAGFVQSGKLREGSVFRLTRFSVSVILKKNVVIINDLELIPDKFDLMGNYQKMLPT